MKLKDDEVEILIHAAQAFYEQHKDDNAKIHHHISPREERRFQQQCTPFAAQVLELFDQAEQRALLIEKQRQEAQAFYAQQQLGADN